MTNTPNEPKEPLNTFHILAFMIDQLASVAWQRMGLQNDMVTGQIHQDLGEAKAAIDGASALFEILGPQLDDEDQRRMQSLLRDLRLNFVNQTPSNPTA